MNSNLHLYKPYIDERIKCSPHIREMISFYKGMIDIWDKALPDDLMPLFSMERLSRGLYMLDKEKTGDIDFKNSTETAENIFKWMDIQKMKESLSSVMNTSMNDISIKATTTEKLGYVGREEGISCYAVVLLNK